MIEVLTFSSVTICSNCVWFCRNMWNQRCQRSPRSCFKNSSWTHYDATVHFVRTYTILTFLAFFSFFSLFTSSLVAVSSTGLTFCHHCHHHHPVWQLLVTWLPIQQRPVWLGQLTIPWMQFCWEWFWLCLFWRWLVCWCSVWWDCWVPQWLVWLCWASVHL